jgi:hypothetical protein
MRNRPHLSTRSRLRLLAYQVERPRLRPCWRIAIKAVAAAAAIALVWLAEHAALNALVGGKPALATTRTISPEQERALDAFLARVDAERAADEERVRRMPAFDPNSCEVDYGVDVAVCDEWMYQHLGEERAARERAAEEARRAAERRPSGRPPRRPSGVAPSQSRR